MEAFHTHVSTRKTAQKTPVPGKNQIKNSEAGYVFELDNWGQLDRFLVLGVAGGSYYASERKLTIDNAKAVEACIKEDGVRTVEVIKNISLSGRAPKNDPALFALAMCSALGNTETRNAAFEALPAVARIGTHLFHFTTYRQAFAGWGRGMREAVANWYLNKSNDKLAYQMVKYQQRDGWSHRDVIRKSHPKTEDTVKNGLFAYAVGKQTEAELPAIIGAFDEAKNCTDKNRVIQLITDFGLTREMVPTQMLKEADVWEALLVNMPMTAMIRNLGNMSKVGLLKPMSSASKTVVNRLNDVDMLGNARVHPIQLLSALKVYGAGKGVRGSGSWTTVPQVTDALNDAFYKSFDFVEPTGKRHLLGIDVSGSMGWNTIAGVPGVTPAMGAAAMAMVAARTEQEYYAHGFTSQFVDLGITPNMRLDDVMRKTLSMNFGATDCSLPMIWALTKGIDIDVFVVYTDSETYAGRTHPFQALKEYRRKTGINAKLIVVGMLANNFTIADPSDAGMLDVVGFDTAAPTVMADFVR